MPVKNGAKFGFGWQSQAGKGQECGGRKGAADAASPSAELFVNSVKVSSELCCVMFCRLARGRSAAAARVAAEAARAAAGRCRCALWRCWKRSPETWAATL